MIKKLSYDNIYMSIANLFVENDLKLYAESVQLNETSSLVTTTTNAAQIQGGIVTVNTGGGAVSCQLPTATSLVNQFPNYVAGDIAKCLFLAFGATNALTLTANTGLTFTGSGSPTLAAQSSRLVYFLFTNVNAGDQAVVVY